MPPNDQAVPGRGGAIPISLLATAGFLSSAGARVVDPLLHAIATDFTTTVPAVSIVVAAFTLPYGLCQLLLGPIGDRFGKLRVMLGALLAYALATGACALAASLPMLTVLRVFAGMASAGLIPVGMAYIGDFVPYHSRQVTLSRFLNGIVFAAILAGPFGGLFGEYIGWRGVFVVLAAGALLVAGLLGSRIRGLPDRQAAGGFSLGNYRRLLRAAGSRRLLIGTWFDGLVLIGCFPFLAPFLHEGFGLNYAEVGLLLSCFGLGALIYTRTARWLIPALGEPLMVMLGGCVVAAGLLIGMATRHWQVFIPVELLLGLGFNMLHAVMQARATELLPDARATAVASFAFMLFMGQSLGALAMGGAIALLGYRAAFRIDAVLVLLLGLWLASLLRRTDAAPDALADRRQS